MVVQKVEADLFQLAKTVAWLEKQDFEAKIVIAGMPPHGKV